MTPGSHQKMVDELNHLLKVERPKTTKVIAWAAGNGDRSENADYIYGKKRLREIDSRLRFLKKRLDNSQVIDPCTIESQTIQFSCTVDVLIDSGEEKTYSIVGIDEVDPDCGKISWRSPLGKSLLGKEVGDEVTVRAPKGDYELEIINLRYEEIK
jgi:transcription elongation factor GreB